MKYTKVGVVEDDGHSPERMVTTAVDTSSFYGRAVWDLVAKHTNHEGLSDPPLGVDVLMTVESCWSGFSEFTITQTWTQVVLTVPAWNWEERWDSLPSYFEALAEASTDRGERA